MGKDLDLKNRKIIKLSKATNADEATTLGQVEELIENLDSVKSIQFDTENPTEVITEGQVSWNNHDKTLNIKTPFGTLQSNQEQVLPVKNANPYPLIDGRIVRITGYNGSYYLIDYADNSKEYSASWDGVLTHTIPAYTGTNDDDVIGHMTTNGLVRELDTSTCQENDIVYLGKDGNWTCVKPISPDYVRIIGKIGAVSETTGEIYVRWSNDSIGDVQESFVAMNMPHGIPVSEKENVVITYNSSLRSVTVTGEFYFYFKSKKYIAYFSEGEDIGHENTTGIHFIYLIVQNDIPLLVSSMTYLQYGQIVPLAIITYNKSTSDTFWSGADGKLFCERHGCEMDKATHTELHENLGCYATTGFGLAGYTAGSGTGGLTANSFSVDTGYVKDEDNWTLLPQLPDNNGVGANYNIYYKSGSEWRWYKNNLPYLFTNTNIVRNVITAGSGSLVEITNNGYFMNMWIVGMPELDKTTGLPTNEGISLIIGQNQYTTLALAQASSFFDLDLSGFPSQEIAPLWQIIFQRQSGYDDNGNCRIEAVRRIVGTRFVNGTQATSPSVHNNLSGRSATDCHPISSITGLQTITDNAVLGPVSATDNAIARYDGTTGKLIQNSSVVIDDSGNVGIGTNNPTDKLHVIGNIRSSVEVHAGTKVVIASKVEQVYDSATDTLKFNFI